MDLKCDNNDGRELIRIRSGLIFTSISHLYLILRRSNEHLRRIMNTRSGLCNSCGVYIGTENWSSCPNCGDENCGDKVDSGYDENDDDADEDEQF